MFTAQGLHRTAQNRGGILHIHRARPLGSAAPNKKVTEGSELRFNLHPSDANILASTFRSSAVAFVKGQSGNPGGKSKVLVDGRTLTDLARDHTEKAVKSLVAVLDNAEATDAAKVSAATAILDRGWGRPKQDLGIEMKPDEASAALLEQARKRAAGG